MPGVHVSAPVFVTVTLTLPAWFWSTGGSGTGLGKAYVALYGECVTNSFGGFAVAWPVSFLKERLSVAEARSDSPLLAWVPSAQRWTRSRPPLPRSKSSPAAGQLDFEAPKATCPYANDLVASAPPTEGPG